jgi:hypothetical protein
MGWRTNDTRLLFQLMPLHLTTCPHRWHCLELQHAVTGLRLALELLSDEDYELWRSRFEFARASSSVVSALSSGPVANLAWPESPPLTLVS